MTGFVTPSIASSLKTGPSEEFFVFQFRLKLAIQDFLTHRQHWREDGTPLCLDWRTDPLAILKL